MYTGYLLTDNTRALLLAKFPPKYPDVICHHITEEFGVASNTPAPKVPTSVKVVGYVSDGKGVEGLMVSVDGSTVRPDGKTYHITLSIDRANGYKPVDTNKLFEVGAESIIGISPIDIKVQPKLFK